MWRRIVEAVVKERLSRERCVVEQVDFISAFQTMDEYIRVRYWAMGEGIKYAQFVIDPYEMNRNSAYRYQIANDVASSAAQLTFKDDRRFNRRRI